MRVAPRFALAAILFAAPLLAQAQVACDSTEFPGVTYAAQIDVPDGLIDAALDAGADVGPARTLLVVDVDNTLLDMHGDLGADQWYRWQSQLIETCGEQPMEVAAEVPDTPTDGSEDCKRSARFSAMLDVQYLLFGALPMRGLDGMAETVAGLQDLEFPIIALTARNPRAMDATLRELRRNGFDLSRTAPPADLSLPSADPTRPVHYRDGLAMVSGYHKGERQRLEQPGQQHRPQIACWRAGCRLLVGR